MTRPRHRLAALVTATGVLGVATGVLLSGCGGGSTRAAGSTSASAAPPSVTHADPVTLLPTAAEVSQLISPASRPSRYDERLTTSTLSSAFSSAVARSARLASGTAELDVGGRKGTFLYVHVFEFKNPAGARSLARTFLDSTRLGNTRGRPSGSPGQEAQVSSHPYGTRQVSYRYAFRDGNVLAYVELDGPRGRYSVSDLIRLATLTDQHVKAASG